MPEAVIVATARTPIGKAFRGAFNDTEAPVLGGHVIRAALEMAADEWPNVRVEGGPATAAVLAYADRIRAIDPAEVLAKVGAAF